MLNKSALMVVFMMTIGMAGTAQAGASFEISGDFEASVNDATASILRNEHVDIPMLQVRADRYMVTLFFSHDFSPTPGTYRIQFNYLNEKNVLGGSVIISGSDDYVMLSYDTAGTAVFEVFDDNIKGTFEFTTFDGPKEPRQQVTVAVSFDLPRGDAFR